MTGLWPFLVIGVFSGSIYALASLGVVLTYKTSGVFNFAYGAQAMVCAFTYWQLHDSWGLTAWVSLPLLLLVVGPLTGLCFERLFRPLADATPEIQIVAAIACIGFFQALVDLPVTWGGQTYSLQNVFPLSTFVLGGHLHVGWDQLGTLLVSLAAGGALWWLLRHTRFGMATRAVVDNDDLAGIIGVDTRRVRQSGWIISSVFAALVGVLLSPTQGLNGYQLTTVVIFAFAPAVIARLRSLPVAFGAALGLGIVMSVLSRWGSSGTVADVEASVPYLALFVALVVLAPRLRVAGRPVPRLVPRGDPLADGPGPAGRAPTGRAGRLVDRQVGAGLVTLVLAVLAPLVVHGARLDELAQGAAYALAALTLVVLVGWAGQISLAQMSFAGVGAFTVGHLAGAHGAHFVPALLAGMAIAVPVALVLGYASLRLSGLFLALATMAFALLMDNLVFNRPGLTGGLTGMLVARPTVAGLRLASPASLYELAVAVLAVAGFVALWLRRGPVGRRLQILRDSPLAAATLGADLTVTTLVTFAACGAVAALAGGLYAVAQQAITPADFNFGTSLELLLLVVLGGRAVVSGAVVAGAVWAVETLHLIAIPITLVPYVPLGVALGVLALARSPEGTVSLAVAEARRVLVVLRPRPRRPLPAPAEVRRAA